MATINDLQSLANAVANATEVGENTAERVGGALQKAAELIAQLLSDQEQNATADGSRDISIRDLQQALATLETNLQNEGNTRASADSSLQGLITALQNQINTLTGTNASQAIENFQEVIRFLSGVKDNDSLTALLDAINTRIGDLEEQESTDIASVNQAITTKVDAAKSEVNQTISNVRTSLESSISGVQQTLEGEIGNTQTELEDQISAVQTSVNNLAAKRDQPNGLASLDENGLVPAKNIPDTFKDVVVVTNWDKNVGSGFPTSGIYGYNSSTNKLYQGVFYVITTDAGYSRGWKWVERQPSEEKIYLNIVENVPYRWNGTEMTAIAARAIAASIYNPTVENNGRNFVLLDTEDTANSAVHVAKANKKEAVGLMLTFALKKGTWKTYQYIGPNTDDNNWYDDTNWKDFGSLAAGSEAMIDIDSLVPLTSGSYYNLGTALSALKQYQDNTGVNYRKRGLVISYSIEANKVETKQYQGDSVMDDFWLPALWQDFGGGSKLVANDTPTSGGKDAFSTGGAYKQLPTEIEATEDAGSVSIALKNKDGETLSETQFSVGTGTGGGGGTTMAINFKDDPIYVLAGGSAVVKTAIRSVTNLGDGAVQANKIVTAVFTNRTTKTTVASFKPNQPSSSDLKDYSFEFDLSSIATSAGSTNLQMVATDATGKTALRNVELIAVDVTVESSQTLSYTKETSLQVGGHKVSIPMYRYPNNASDKGIRTKIEMYKNGAWETLAELTVNDTYTHNVTIDPTGLGHGAYPIRIQGTDVASGITGNVLHTAVMVIEQRDSVSDYNKPIIVARWSDASKEDVKLFESVLMDIACYQRSNINPTVDITVTDQTTGEVQTIASKVMNRTSYYSVEQRIVGYQQGDVLLFDATCESTTLTEKRTLTINGSLLGVAETDGAYYKINLTGRSNSDTDKSITAVTSDGGQVAINVHDSNYSTNGFVKDTFGEAVDNGRMSLRIAEDVTAECTDQPFASSSILTNGMALSLTFKVKNIAKRDAQIMRCMSGKLGFVLTGEKFIVTVNGDSAETLADVKLTAATSYLDDTVYRIDLVIEPQAKAPYSGIMLCKVFQNGDEAACVPIDSKNGFPTFTDVIHFDGHDADLYLYEVTRWNTYYDFIQAFNNYIVNLTDTQAMLTEYEKNQVMSDSTAEGVTKPRPDMQKLLDRGVMVVVETRTEDANLSTDGSQIVDSPMYYPDYLEPLKEKDTKVLMNWYVYFPDRPWADCEIVAVPVTNQGTSTLAYPIKNKKAKFKKCKAIKMLHTRQEVSDMYNGDETILAKYDDAVALAKKFKIRVKDGSTPVNTITIKVDYSDSTGANNGSLMELMNETQIALGGNYMTPAQRYGVDGSKLHTSVDSVTCALFRTDYRVGQSQGSLAATLPENAYFHSKGNFNVDKDNPAFFGFQDVVNYNSSCVYYGDFKELVAAKGQSLDDFKAALLADPSSLVPGELYMLSEYCGPKNYFIENDGTGAMTEIGEVNVDPDYVLTKTLSDVLADSVKNYKWGEPYKTSDGKYVQYKGGNWIDTTGTISYDSATNRFSTSGNVLNPVECFEFLQYQEFCWLQGVNSVEDMMKTVHTDAGDVPIWTTYYKCRYPDDDDLNDLYASGKKVPYNLYRMLLFAQQCNQNLTEDAATNGATNADGSAKIYNGAGAATTITLDGQTVPGTKENRLKKWQHEMHKVFCPESTNCYVVASDYKATVDQRAKNMMVAFYLESDMSVRAYWNHWYDGDSCDEADNDCFLTIPWDVEASTSHLYQGWDGVMFKQSYALYERGEGVWLDDGGTQVLTLHDTAKAMRETQTSAGLPIFSADGCNRYWMQNRINKWPKVVSSFDGERKYIEMATQSDNRYPALHGLRLDSLPAFQRKRFAFRDGFYQTGDLFSHFFQDRMMGPIAVKITAAQDGYFGLGVDSTSSAKYSIYLNEGESYTFVEPAAGEGGKLIYLFGANKVAELDISGCTPKNSNWMIGELKLLRKLIIGGANYVPAYTTDLLSVLNLGQMPFLEELDIRNTKILRVDATQCPRLNIIRAEGSLLQSFTPAEASPLEVATLPATMVDVKFVNMPKIAYPANAQGVGLTFAGMTSIKTLTLSGCPKIDQVQLLTDLVAGGATLTQVSVKNIKTTADATVLNALKAAKTIGVGSDNTAVCDGMAGQWTMKYYTDESLLASLSAYFPNLNVRQQAYSDYKEFDNVIDSENVTNLDNGTGYDSGLDYVPSGHILNIRSRSVPVKGKYNRDTRKMRLTKMSTANYTKLADGTAFDNKDLLGEQYDCFMFIPHFWYKGVNDFIKQEKHTLLSGNKDMPEPTYTKLTQPKLSSCLYADTKGILTSRVDVGATFSDALLSDLSSCATYRMDVEGMKMARYIGLNSATYCAVFVNASGVILAKNVFAVSGISDSPMDFKNENGDYIFRTVPEGAKYLYFTCIRNLPDADCIILATDSTDIEAVEPGWVEHKAELIGIYGGTVDDMGLMRSVSGKQTKRGNNTSVTSAEWQYDSEGNPTNMPVGAMNYTYQDILNLCRYRGVGYHSISYEQSKIIAVLSRCYYGNKDDQRIYGFGCGPDYTTGYQDAIGSADTVYGSANNVPNKVWGIEGFIACMWEIMDNVGVNISTFAAWKAAKRPDNDNTMPSDAKWHIYNSNTKTERVVQGISSDGYNIMRVKHGRYCDVVASSFSTDRSAFSTGYAAGQYYSSSKGRCVGRANYNAVAGGGLVYASSNVGSSLSFSSDGGRLAFDGELENESEIDSSQA